MDILFKNDDFVFSYRVGGILKHNGKILLQRPKNDDYAIIGGHVAAMETSMERKTHIAEMFALNCTELPGAAIDACGAGISLRGISVAAGMTEVKPIMHSALTVEKSTYNGSSR